MPNTIVGIESETEKNLQHISERIDLPTEKKYAQTIGGLMLRIRKSIRPPQRNGEMRIRKRFKNGERPRKLRRWKDPGMFGELLE